MDFNILLDDDPLLSKYSHDCLVVIDYFFLFAYFLLRLDLLLFRRHLYHLGCEIFNIDTMYILLFIYTGLRMHDLHYLPVFLAEFPFRIGDE